MTGPSADRSIPIAAACLLVWASVAGLPAPAQDTVSAPDPVLAQDTGPDLNTAAAQLASDPAAALAVIQPAARRGIAQAQFLLGEAYRAGGAGLDQDLRLAREWLGKSAAQGHMPGVLALAELDLTTGDLAAGLAGLDRAMAAGHAPAFARRAALLAAGQGAAPPDPGGALALYGVALELGFAPAAIAMTDLILAQPQGDTAQARRLLAQGAALGDAAALARLGMFYRDGIGGPADPVAAFALLQEAVSLGSPDGAVALAALMAAPTPSDSDAPTDYWVNPVLGLAYCLWAERTAPQFTGACASIAAPLSPAEQAEAAALAARF